MRAVTSLMLAIVLVAWASQEAFAMGGDHPKERVAAQGRNCVHGYFINESDVFFYAGDAAEFNKFAADQTKKQGSKLRVVVHNGAKKARSPWDKADRDILVDWSMTTGPMAWGARQKGEGEQVRIDLWLGGKVKKEDVKYPPGTEASVSRRPTASGSPKGGPDTGTQSDCVPVPCTSPYHAPANGLPAMLAATAAPLMESLIARPKI